MENISVIGFDVRISIMEQRLQWPEARRAQFLINPDVLSPISVDPLVWPVAVANPNQTLPLHLWESIDHILGALSECREDVNRPAVIDIGVVAPTENYWSTVFGGRRQAAPEESFGVALEFLGYDIADRFLLSGLSNCMLSRDELLIIRRDWSKALNHSGLIEKIDAAKAMRTVFDRLIPEHAPFEIYRLRRIL